MSNMLHGSTFFCMAISLFGYEAGIFLRKKLKIGIFNPLLVSIVFVIIVLKVTGIDYDTYDKGANVLSYLLTPSTVCLAIPLYQQMNLLKKNLKAIIAGITTGVFVSLAGVWVFSMLFHLKKQFYVTLLPKSITTAIGMGISEELGGIVTITVAAIVITGIIGNMFAEGICKLCKIEHPIAKGLAIGTASHAMGTAKAMEIGEIEELAEEGPCIIMGRCAGYLMRNREEAFSVFVHADMETRIERVKERDHITSRMKAKRKIQDVDEKRSAFRKDYTGQEWGMSKNYDLSVSTTELSYEQAVDLILYYKKMTEESDRA